MAITGADVTITKDSVKEVLKTIRDLTNKRVLVGIPESADARPEGKAGNALIGYVQENGCPELNIPARPFLVPGVQNATEESTRILKRAGVAALQGDGSEVDNRLNQVGLMCAASVKDKMDTGPFKPLADSTLEARVRKGGGSQVGAKEELESRREGNPPGTDLAQPLIDTGNLQNSITYVIRDMRDKH